MGERDHFIVPSIQVTLVSFSLKNDGCKILSKLWLRLSKKDPFAKEQLVDSVQKVTFSD